jgi:hypothetical protein
MSSGACSVVWQVGTRTQRFHGTLAKCLEFVRALRQEYPEATNIVVVELCSGLCFQWLVW